MHLAQTTQRSFASLVGILLLAFLGLGARGVWEPDEGFYGGVAAEMVQSGDWWTPRLHGRLFLDKPPLVYWGAAVGLRCAGVPGLRWAQALWFAAAALLVGVFARRLWDAERGAAAALLYAVTPIAFVAASTLTPDTPLAFAVVAANLTFRLAWEAPRGPGRIGWSLAFAVAVALGGLAKGPAMLVYLAPLAMFALLTGGWRGALARADLVAAALVGSGVALAWYVRVVGAAPGGWEFVLHNQVTGRVYLADYDRHPGLAAALLLYPLTLLVGLAPWCLPWLVATLRTRGRRVLAQIRGADLQLVLWAVVPLAVFSLASSRLPLYILPAVPAYVLLLSRSRVATGRSIAPAAMLAVGLLLVALRWGAGDWTTSRDSTRFARQLDEAGIPRGTPLIAYQVKRNGLALSGYPVVGWLPSPTEAARFFRPPSGMSELLSALGSSERFAVLVKPRNSADALRAVATTGRTCDVRQGPFGYVVLSCRPIDGSEPRDGESVGPAPLALDSSASAGRG